jgi:hypothetical protein
VEIAESRSRSVSNENLEIGFQVYHVLNSILMVNLGHMPSDGYVMGIAWRRSQLAREITWYPMFPQPGINRVTYL